jgi:hypothetical protein
MGNASGQSAEIIASKVKANTFHTREVSEFFESSDLLRGWIESIEQGVESDDIPSQLAELRHDR